MFLISRLLGTVSVQTSCLYLIAGILLVEILPDLLPIWAVTSTLLFSGLIFYISIRLQLNRDVQYILSTLSIVAFGVCITHIEIYRQSHDMLPQTGRYAFEAVVEQSELRGQGQVRALLRPLDSYPDTASSKSAKRDLKQYGSMRLTMRLETMPQAGDRLNVAARLFPLSGPFLPGMPDYGRSAYLNGIGASGFAYGVTKRNEKTDKYAFSDNIERMRNHLDLHLQETFHPQIASIVSALYLGKRDRLSADIYTLFQKSGLAHLLAISGLHMALFCMSLYGLLRIAILPAEIFLPISAHKIAAFLAILAGFAYLLIAGTPVSALRAWSIAAIILVAVIVDRRALTLRTLALVALMLLIWRPSYLFQPAFQLSFSATFGIIATYQMVKGKIPRRGLTGFLIGLAITSLAAGIVTAPFIAYHFAIFIPYSLLSNMLAVPLMSLLMPFGLLVLMLDTLGVTIGLLTLYEGGMFALIEIASFFSRLPVAGIWIKPPSFTILILWMLSICLFFSRRLILQTLSILGICLCFWQWWQLVQPDIIHIYHQEKPVFIINAPDRLVSTHSLSPFWISVIERQVGQKPLHLCDEAVCKVLLHEASVHFVVRPKGITQACNDMESMTISLIQPKYPCKAEARMVHLVPQPAHTFYQLDLSADTPVVHLETISQINRPWRLFETVR